MQNHMASYMFLLILYAWHIAERPSWSEPI